MNRNQNDQEYLVQKVRTEYTQKQYSEFDALKALDRRVKAPVNRFAWCFGTLAALILGAGMSLIMTDIGATIGLKTVMLPGLVLGIVGLLMAIVNYPIYQRRMSSRRKKYADQIVALSDQIMQGKTH